MRKRRGRKPDRGASSTTPTADLTDAAVRVRAHRRSPVFVLKPWRGSPVSHVIDPVNAGESGNTRLGPSCRPAEFEQLVMCDALTLSGVIKRREVSCVDVMTAYLDHIEVHNPGVNAIVALRDRDE